LSVRFFPKPFLPQLFRRPAGTDPSLRFRSLNRTFVGWAQRGDPFSQPSGSSALRADVLAESNFEPKGVDRMNPAPASLRLGFVGQRLFTPAASVWQAALALALRPIPVLRDQKTFSAGPCSFNVKELWFPKGLSVSRVQPVADSRPGRIACKILSPPPSSMEARRAAAPNQTRGLVVQPLRWLTAALPKSVLLHGQLRKHPFLVIVDGRGQPIVWFIISPAHELTPQRKITDH
jgi:hypothetical protein